MAVVLPMASSNAHSSTHAHDHPHHHPSLRSRTLSSSASSAPGWSTTTANAGGSSSGNQNHYHYPQPNHHRHQRTHSASRVEVAATTSRQGQTRAGWEQEGPEGFHPQPRPRSPPVPTRAYSSSSRMNRSMDMGRPPSSRSSSSSSSPRMQRVPPPPPRIQERRSRSVSVEMEDGEEVEEYESRTARSRLRRVYPMRIDDEEEDEDEDEEDEVEDDGEDEEGSMVGGSRSKHGYMHPLRPAVFPILRDSPSPEPRMVRAGFGTVGSASPSMLPLHPVPHHTQHHSPYSTSGMHRSDESGANGHIHSGTIMNGTATSTTIANGGNGGMTPGGNGGPLGVHRTRRPRRRADEVERLYKCTWNGCEKSYGTLSHLNDHVRLQRHGNKREPHEFKEARRVWRQERKSRRLREHAIHAAQAAQHAAAAVSNVHQARMHATGGSLGAPASHGPHSGPRLDTRNVGARPLSSSSSSYQGLGGYPNGERTHREDPSYYQQQQQHRAYLPPPHSQPPQHQQQPPAAAPSQLVDHQPQLRALHQSSAALNQQPPPHDLSGESQRRQVAEWTEINARFGSDCDEFSRRRRLIAREGRSGPDSPEAAVVPGSATAIATATAPSQRREFEVDRIANSITVRSSLRPRTSSNGTDHLVAVRDNREPELAEIGELHQRGESRLGLALGHPRHHHPGGNSNSISNHSATGSATGSSLLFSRDNRAFTPSPVPSPFLRPSSGINLAPPLTTQGARARAATVSTLTSLSSDSESIARMHQQLQSRTHSPSPSEKRYGKDDEDEKMTLMDFTRVGDGKYWDRDRNGEDEILIRRSPSPSGSIQKGDKALRLPSIAELRLDLSLDEYEAQTALGSLSTAGSTMTTTTTTTKHAMGNHHRHQRDPHSHSYSIGGASVNDRVGGGRDSAFANAGTVTPTAIRPSSATPTTVDYYQHNQPVRAVRHRHRESWESPSPRLGEERRRTLSTSPSDGLKANSGSNAKSPYLNSLAPPPPYHIYQQQQQQLQAQAQQGTRTKNQSLTPTMMATELESPRMSAAGTSPDYTSHYRFRIAPPPPSSSTMTATPSSSGMSLSSATTSPLIDTQQLRGSTLTLPPPPPPTSYPHPRSRTSSSSHSGRRLSTSRPSTSASTTSSTTSSATAHTIQYPFIQASLPRVHSTPDVRASSVGGMEGKMGTVMISATPGVVTGEPRRKRRKFEEIERRYQCGWNGCTKAYGTLNHLNDHVSLQNHGPKRRSSEF